MRFLNSGDVIAWEGEIESRTLFLEIEDVYNEYNVRIDYQIPTGEKIKSEPLVDRTKYVLNECAMSTRGELKAQIVVYNDDESFVIKSPVRVFRVFKSINAGRSLPDIYNLQGKEVTIEGNTTIKPDEGYYGLNEVIINVALVKTDVVLTYNDLVNYDTEKLKAKDKIIVLLDSNNHNVTTVYAWDEGQFNLMGQINFNSYTKEEIDVLLSSLTETLQNNINTEANARANKDTELENAIDNIIDGTTTVDKASKDSDGNIIKDTYQTKLNPASNDSLGTIRGTVISDNVNYIISIENGHITQISIKRDDTWLTLSSSLNDLITFKKNVIDGTQIVGKANADKNGNIIDETYATKTDLNSEITRAQTAENTKLNKSGNNTYDGNLTIAGDLTVQGTEHIVDIENVSTEETIIEVAKSNTQPLTQMAGMVANNYNGENSGGLLFDNNGTAYVGDLENSILYSIIVITEVTYIPNKFYYLANSKYILDTSPTYTPGRTYYQKTYANVNVANNPKLQPLATRSVESNLANNHLIKWDSTNKKFIDAGKGVSDIESLISQESTARQSADSQLQTNINTEANARAHADAALQNDITNLEDDLEQYKLHVNNKFESIDERDERQGRDISAALFGLTDLDQKSSYNLGTYDIAVENADDTVTITRQTGYLDVSKLILDNQDIGFFRNTPSGYEYDPLGLDVVYTENAYGSGYELTFKGNYNFESGDAYINQDKFILTQTWISLPNTYDTKDKYLEYFRNNHLIIQYKLATSYPEKVIPNRPLNTLDQNGSQWVRDEWEKGLNLINITDTTLNGFIFNETFNLASGTYTLTITGNENIACDLVINNVSQGYYYTNNLKTFTITKGDTLGIYVSGTLTNAKVMLNEGNHAYPYQPYNANKHITNDEATLLKEEFEKSENLANVQDTNETIAGVNNTTISQHIVINGTATSNNAVFVRSNLTLLPIGTYTIKFFGQKLPSGCYVFDGASPKVVNNGTSITIETGFGQDYFQFNTISGTTYDLDFYIMFVKGSTAPTIYQPYNGEIVHKKELDNAVNEKQSKLYLHKIKFNILKISIINTRSTPYTYNELYITENFNSIVNNCVDYFYLKVINDNFNLGIGNLEKDHYSESQSPEIPIFIDIVDKNGSTDNVGENASFVEDKVTPL